MTQRLTLTLLLAIAVGCGSSPVSIDGGSGGGGAASGGGGGVGIGGGGASTGGGTGGSGGGTSTGGGTGTGGGSPIDFSDSCATLTPCDSSPVGSWTYSSACVSASNPWPPVKNFCSGITFAGMSGTMSGTLDITATTVTQHSTWAIQGTVTVPRSCFADAGIPSGGSDIVLCALMGPALTGAFDAGFPPIVKTASCSPASGGGGCSCAVTDTRAIDAVGSSSFDGGVLTVVNSQPSTTRTYGYCANGGTLTYGETTTPVAIDSAIYTLH